MDTSMVLYNYVAKYTTMNYVHNFMDNDIAYCLVYHHMYQECDGAGKWKHVPLPPDQMCTETFRIRICITVSKLGLVAIVLIFKSCKFKHDLCSKW